MEQNFMKEKPILQLVITMSLPMILSMMVNSLYNIIDSFFCGPHQRAGYDSPVLGVSGAEYD